jgi:pyruvate-formate lyase
MYDFDTNPGRCTWHYLTGFTGGRRVHPFLREANGRFELYSKCPVYIDPGHLIVGDLDRAVWREAVACRISSNLLQQRIVDEVMESPDYTPEEKADLATKMEIMRPHLLHTRIEEAYLEEENRVFESDAAASCHFNGHQVLDYGRLLDEGLPGLLADLRARLPLCRRDPDERIAAEAYIKALEGTAVFIRRHAEMAEALIGRNEEGYDDGLLRTVAATCRAITERAPQTFLEGLQLHWFFMGFADYDSFGRFDQYMYPLYEKSRAEGMTRAEAETYLEYYWRKLDEDGSILNMTIGGVKRDGASAVNDLTMMILEVTRKLGLKGPNLCLRIRGDSPEELWDEAWESIGRGQALPALYNEGVIIPMLMAHGISPEDANDFSLAGCSQVVIPGKSSFACDTGEYSALKCLELALHDGFDTRTGKQAGPHTGKPAGMGTFEKVLDAYRAQAFAAIRMGVLINNKDHSLRPDFLSCIRSLLTSDCLERGRGLFRGGARYYAVQNEVIGLTNVANSLAAIRKAVFEDGKYTLEEIVTACDADFEGYEPMRQYLLNRAPKFGNDEESVDELRAQVAREFFTELASHPAPLGGVHWPGEVIFHYHVNSGALIGATPDGRRAGAPMADSCGASQGTDLKGPTAVVKSAMKLPFTSPDYPNTCSCLNLKFTKDLWRRSRGQMVTLMRAYFSGGGFQMQINVLDQRDLIEAKKDPEKYRSLVVRVGGYSAYFVALNPAIQDDIIARTAHGAL